MNTDFPDHLFKFSPSIDPSMYSYICRAGMEMCRNKNILWCGIARNVENNLELNLERYIRTCKAFNKSHMFVYENDSTDETVNILDRYKKFVTYKSEKREDQDYVEKMNTPADPFHFNRCTVLSECRNKYMDYIEENNLRDEYDYICVVDLDTKGGWSYQGFYSSIFFLENAEENAAMTAYGVVSSAFQDKMLEDVHFDDWLFYDSFAYRDLDYDPRMSKGHTQLFNSLKFKVGQDPIEVLSNFNGLGIYKSKFFKHKYQTTMWGETMVDSEHIYVHKSIREDGGKVFLNPSMTLSYSYHHQCGALND